MLRSRTATLLSCLLVCSWLGNVAAFAQTVGQVTARATAAEKPVKVFVIAGQSNAEGKAPNTLLEYQANDAKTADLFAHLRKDGQWIVRDDVFIKFLNRHGGLTIGYGSPDRTGMELEFGTVLGDHFDEPVLIIKAAWGGHSLYKNFRPPSAGLPADDVLRQELEKAQENVKKNNENRQRNDPLPTMDEIKAAYGLSYRNMLDEVRGAMANAGELFPELAGKQLELAGLAWFQGWNDQYNGAEQEYEANMRHFIDDARHDFGVPRLPIVIGVMGQNGSEPATGAMLAIQQAQLAMNDVPEYQGNVIAVRTDELADKAAEALIDNWQDHQEEWQKVGGDRAYHYLGSAIWFNRIGKRMGEAMLGMVGEE